MPRYVFRYSQSRLLIGRRVSLLSEPLSEECVSCQVKAMRCRDTKEQCGWRFGGTFIIKSSFQIPCFSAFCSLPTPPRRLHRNPIFIFFFMMGEQYSPLLLFSHFLPSDVRETSCHPRLTESYHISPHSTFPSCFPFKEFQNSILFA